jgi:hypothetical protein
VLKKIRDSATHGSCCSIRIVFIVPYCTVLDRKVGQV